MLLGHSPYLREISAYLKDKIQTQKKRQKALFQISLKAYFLPSIPKRLLNLSTRPPVSAAFCLPV